MRCWLALESLDVHFLRSGSPCVQHNQPVSRRGPCPQRRHRGTLLQTMNAWQTCVVLLLLLAGRQEDAGELIDLGATFVQLRLGVPQLRLVDRKSVV